MPSIVQTYRAYSPEDLEAFAQLRYESERKLGREIKIAELVAALEPEHETPEALRTL